MSLFEEVSAKQAAHKVLAFLHNPELEVTIFIVCEC